MLKRVLLPIAVLLSSCAPLVAQVRPTGDETPPVQTTQMEMAQTQVTQTQVTQTQVTQIQAAQSQPTQTQPAQTQVNQVQTPPEAQLLARLNQIRAQGVTCPGSGRRPAAVALSFSPAHAQAARLQAGYMASSRRVTHTGQDGSTPRIRAASTGVNAVSLSEIVYLNTGLDPEAAMQWWLGSASHCFWMTEGRYTHAGASVVQGARSTAYVIVLSSQPK
ncbi:CAP domain-containing protein [Deinococcus arenicola]|uniref:CAP domain-containing protein n=1 Tax=Deinococcus arenicola TaxID=2994950 RepID=A0ABU4DM27_9DEIO|nr:CAP domain-containing protein [Deinococcus sp. ZS9-10]MDV6373488.1 CAP domain-containing protein [Deinococcus sp. ZS9-10]